LVAIISGGIVSTCVVSGPAELSAVHAAIANNAIHKDA
jgi:hypothetical protein